MAAGPPPDPYRPCVILSIASPSPKADPGPNRGGAETMWGRISFLLTASAVAFGVAGCQAVPTIPPSEADVPEARAWRAVATEQDRARIRGWYSSGQAALAVESGRASCRERVCQYV